MSSVNYLTSSGIGSPLATDAFTYDGDLRPAGSTATWQSGSGSTGTLYSQGIGYDPAGNVLTQTMTQTAVPGQTGSGGTETQNFCYDEQNRLVYGSNSTATPAAGNGTCGTAAYQQRLGGTYTSTYVYTHLGQLWQGPYNGKGAYQYLYCNTSQPHQLTSVYPTNTNCGDTSGKTQSYGASYDSWGNMTTRTTTGATGTLTYDPQDLLVRWNGSVNNQAEWYMYDGSGSRVLRRSFDGTNITITVYAFGMEEHQYQYSGSGTTDTNTGNTYYYTLGGKLLGTLSGTGTLSTTFLLSDTLGSVVASISNTAGSAAVLGNQAYGPYGNQRYVAGSLGTSKGYTGQYNDSLTGLDYYHARYYDPVVGRFLSADTVQGNGQGMDPYAYVEGNPETDTDPTGRFIPAPDGSRVWFDPSATGGIRQTAPDPSASWYVPQTTYIPYQQYYWNMYNHGPNNSNRQGSHLVNGGRVLKGAAALTPGLAKLVEKLIRNNERLKDDYYSDNWTLLSSKRGTDIVNDNSGGVYIQRWYLTFDDGDGSKVVLSLNLNATPGASDPWDMRHVHFSQGQLDPSKWGEDGYMRANAGFMDPGSSENPSAESSESALTKFFLGVEHVAEEDPNFAVDDGE